jgi:hypothetical protein
MIFNAPALADLPTRVFCPRCCKTAGYVVYFQMSGLWTWPSVLFCVHCGSVLMRHFGEATPPINCSSSYRWNHESR